MTEVRSQSDVASGLASDLSGAFGESARRGPRGRAQAARCRSTARGGRHPRRLPAGVQPAARRRRRLRVEREGTPQRWWTSSARTSSGAATTPTRTTNSRPIDPARTYRVKGNRGDAVYLSMTVYGGPDDGRYSDRIVGTMNDRSLEFDEHGNFEFIAQPNASAGRLAQAGARRGLRADPGLRDRPRHGAAPAVDDRGRRRTTAPPRRPCRHDPSAARGPHLAARAALVPAHERGATQRDRTNRIPVPSQDLRLGSG